MTARIPLVLFVAFSSAAAIAAALVPYAHAVTVGPAKLEVAADPGDTIRGELFVINETDAAATFHASVQQFTEVEGNKVFNDEEGGIASWIPPLAPVTLAPGAQQTVPFTIRVPENAPPGGHFAVIWWSSAPKGTRQLSVVTRAGALVYLTVSGEARRSAQIVSFGAEGGGRFFRGLPVRFEVLIKNEGNVYEKPMGTLTLTNLFGGESARAKVNESGSQVLPRSQKTLPTIELAGDRFLFGPYRANLDLVYGDGAHLGARKWIWVVPLTGVLWMSAIILLLAGAPFGIKKYNAWVLRRASQPDPPKRRRSLR